MLCILRSHPTPTLFLFPTTGCMRLSSELLQCLILVLTALYRESHWLSRHLHWAVTSLKEETTFFIRPFGHFLFCCLLCLLSVSVQGPYIFSLPQWLHLFSCLAQDRRSILELINLRSRPICTDFLLTTIFLLPTSMSGMEVFRKYGMNKCRSKMNDFIYKCISQLWPYNK